MAALNHAGALQYANCPNTEVPKPLTQVAVSPVSVTVWALDPNHKATTALAGKVGTIGGMKKPAPVVAAALATWVNVAPADVV